MLSCSCPRCGAPIRLSLASVARIHCRACGADEATPPDVAQRVAAAGHELQSLDVRKRQLTSGQLRALRWARGLSVFHLVVLLLLALPYGGCGAASIAGMSDAPSGLGAGAYAWMLTLFFGPVLLFGVLAIGGFLWMRRGLANLERAAAAVPPSRPGEPASCHVCGGPLAAHAVGFVARCSYCNADNIVSPSALARAASLAAGDASAHAQTVTARANAVTNAGVAVVAVLPALALLSPIVAIGLWIIAMASAVHVEGAVDPKMAFVVVDTDKGSLFVRQTPERGAVVPKGIARRGAATSDKRQAATWLVGRRVRTLDTPFGPGHDGKVLGVYSSPFMPDAVYARVQTAGTSDVDPVEISGGLFVLD